MSMRTVREDRPAPREPDSFMRTGQRSLTFTDGTRMHAAEPHTGRRRWEVVPGYLLVPKPACTAVCWSARGRDARPSGRTSTNRVLQSDLMASPPTVCLREITGAPQISVR